MGALSHKTFSKVVSAGSTAFAFANVTPARIAKINAAFLNMIAGGSRHFVRYF